VSPRALDVRSAAPLDFAGPTSGADSAVIERPPMVQSDSRQRISVTFDEP